MASYKREMAICKDKMINCISVKDEHHSNGAPMLLLYRTSDMGWALANICEQKYRSCTKALVRQLEDRVLKSNPWLLQQALRDLSIL